MNSCVNSDIFLYFLAVCDERFYMIGFMSCYDLPDEGFLPCEIGAVEYSLSGGILRKMHYFIKPGLSQTLLCVQQAYYTLLLELTVLQFLWT